MPTVNLALLGFGNVGRALARLLIKKEDVLQAHYNITWHVVGIFTNSHAAAIHPDGIDLHEALSRREAGTSLAPLSTHAAPRDAVEFILQSGADVLFENTPVNYQSGQPALDHIRTALESGMHAITANKGPVVHAYDELNRLAEEQGKCFYFESTVMDGAPIFALWRETLPAAEIHAMRGVLNSTTNLILTLMEEGHSFEQAVSHAQAIGIAETDPSGDTLGWDAAIKVAALTTVLLRTPLKPDQVAREGIETITPEDIRVARAANKRWKLICQVERQGDHVFASVKPECIGADDPMFNVMGTSSAMTLQSDVLGDLTLMEADPGPHTTAYGLLADFIQAVRGSH